MMKDIEVEIRHLFNDPSRRANAFHLYSKMEDWLSENNAKAKLRTVLMEDGEIAWRFKFQCDDDARAFDVFFDPTEKDGDPNA